MRRQLEHALIENVDDRRPFRRLRGERFAEENRRAQIDGDWRSKRAASSAPISSVSKLAALLTSKVSGPTFDIRRRQKPGNRGVVGKIRLHHCGAPACARDLHRAALPHPGANAAHKSPPRNLHHAARARLRGRCGGRRQSPERRGPAF